MKRIGVVCRFKPVHLAHQAMLESLLEEADELLVGIGSSNRYDPWNPFTADETRDVDTGTVVWTITFGGAETGRDLPSLLASQTELEGAQVLAEKIRSEIADTGFTIEDAGGPHTVRITVSIGVAPFKGDRSSFFQEADAALYRAKRGGKNCVVVASADAAPD